MFVGFLSSDRIARLGKKGKFGEQEKEPKKHEVNCVKNSDSLLVVSQDGKYNIIKINIFTLFM